MRRAAIIFPLAALGCGFDEADALDRQIRLLDAKVVRHRAIARNLPRYKEEVQRLFERVREAEGPFVDAELEPALTRIRGMTQSSTVTGENVGGMIVIHVVGLGGNEAAARAIRRLRVVPVLMLSAVDVHGDEWRLAVKTSVHVLERPPAYVPASNVPPKPPRSSIYPWVDERRKEVHGKQTELWRLARIVGDVARFTPQKRRLEQLLVISEAMAKETSRWDDAIEKLGAGGDVKASFE